MKKKILPIFILLRLWTNDGIFIEIRRPQIKIQPPEIRASIRRIWKRGGKLSYKGFNLNKFG